MNSQFLVSIFLLAQSFRQFSCVQYNEKLLTSGNLTTDQLKQVCGISAFSQSRIVGGKDAKAGEWPWQAEISLDESGLCGGSVINYYFILTAAHCVYKKNESNVYNLLEASKVKVKLGHLNRIQATSWLDFFSQSEDNTTKTYQAKKIIPHEGYIPDIIYYDDIALIELEQKIVFSKWTVPICLPKSSNSNYENKSAVVIGWGLTKHGGNSSVVLQQVTLKVYSDSICQKAIRKYTSTHICAGDEKGGKDSCQGDSGGPLMLRDKNDQETEIGVVSYGEGCGDAKQPGVYTRVASYLDWIKKNARMM